MDRKHCNGSTCGLGSCARAPHDYLTVPVPKRTASEPLPPEVPAPRLRAGVFVSGLLPGIYRVGEDGAVEKIGELSPAE
jgi:hypothetical protein